MRRRLALAFGLAGTALVLLALNPSGAYAEAPVRVAWWNNAASNGMAAPSPTTPAGGLHVAAGPGAATPVGGVGAHQEEVQAFGAVLYQADEGSTATLTLKIAPNGSQGTPQLVACPTQNADWTIGDDQPGPGPNYDCSSAHFAGTVDPGGTTVVFHVSADFESTAGEVSLAIVPDLGSTALPTGPSPFSIDFNPPDAASFLAEPSAASSSDAFNPAPYSGPVSTSLGGPLGLPALAVPAPAPASATSPATATAPALAPRAGAAAPTAVESPVLVWRGRAGAALGALCLVVAVLLWASGFGLLGGRVAPLSIPLKRA